MSSELVTRAKVQPLDTVEDWSTWETQMEDLLWEAKLWDYVSGKKKRPVPVEGETVTAQKQAEMDTWDERDRTALSAIRLRVSKRVMKLIKNVRTSHDAWEKLKKNFETKGLGKVLELKRKISGSRYSDGEDLDEWLQQMAEWREDLISLGRDIPDDEFSITLLAALPDSWKSFTDSFRDEDILDADRVQGRIREHARRLQATDSALVAKQKRSGTGPLCYKCGKPGLKRDCPNHERRKSAGSGSSKGRDEEKGRRKEDRKGKGGGSSKTMVAEESAESDSDYSCTALELETQTGDVALPAVPGEAWIVDSGTTSHVARERRLFVEYTSTPGRTLHGAGSTPILGQGSIRMRFVHGGKSTLMTLRNVLHAPGVPYNLLSVGRVEATGHKVEMDGGEIRLRNEKGRVYAVGKRIGNFLYRIEGEVQVPNELACAAAVSRPIRRKKTLNEWHRILGHPGMKSVVAMWKKNLVTGMEVDESVPPEDQCEACVRGKQTVAPYPKRSETVVEEIGDLVVMDTWGPASTQGVRGERYFWAFTDMHSRWSEAAFGKHKSEALEHFKAYAALIENKFGRKIKKIRCDNGGEFLSKEFKAYLRESGIELETTAPESSAQNGVAERLHRTLLDRARAMRIAAGLPKFLWPLAVAHAVYLKNRLPTHALKEKTPAEVWNGQKPDVADLQEWGTKCWVLTSPDKRSKLDPRSEAMHFVGIAPGSKAWLYYDPRSRRVGKSRNIVFAIQQSQAQPPESDDDDYLIRITPAPLEGEKGPNVDKQSERASCEPSSGEVQPPAQASAEKTQMQAPERRQLRAVKRINYKTYGDTGEKVPLDEAHIALALTLVGTESVHEPRNLREAQAQPEWPEWSRAMDQELAQLRQLKTFRLTDLPPGRSAIGCRWVYRLKRDSEGRIIRYKARLVAQGFSQVPGLDYFETFAPVIRMDSLRTMLAIAAARGMALRQWDVVGAYLNADLDEEIYMRQPPGYEDGSGRVLRVLKAMYGLKQAGRKWNERFNRVMVDELKFKRLDSEPCAYIKTDDRELVMLGLHVDDMLGAGDCDELLDTLEDALKCFFQLTSLGFPRLLLGLEVTQDPTAGSITIRQTHFIQTALQRFGMADCAPVSTPMDPNVKLLKEPEDTDLSEMKDIPYQAAIGTLMYAALGTRPDISYAVQTLSQFSSRPGPSHWTAVKRVFRYLKGTLDHGITYGRYSDADWGANPVDCKSISGYAFLIGGGVVAWSSKKQAVVALSSTEAEYMAISYAARHTIWMRTLLSELTFVQKGPTQLNADNLSAIALSRDNVHHARSKHIDIRHHFIRECVESDTIVLKYVPTDQNVADFFTKALTRERFHQLRVQLGILSDAELRGSVGDKAG
ncbi:hypothetical protein ONZ51_g5747 [Trametes cubensis]|uniref:Integrase catalytic domain-containing protein n=1 Tax=Trametes cubensis TaxID=1111947 RepID=A0AAD7XBT0_9APHY|nr:hypothetical protein ONZ51_g5747 [Trametes cubensis]